MKKLFKKIIASPITLIFVLFAVLCLPASLNRPAQGDLTSIVTAVGIDKENNGLGDYYISIQILTASGDPKSSENSETVSAAGKSVADGLNNISLKLGKSIGLQHCAIIVIGSGAAAGGANLKNDLDYMLRSGKLNPGTTVIYTEGKAKDILNESSELNELSTNSIQNNVGYNKNFLDAGRVSTLQTFFNEYKSPSGIGLLAIINSENAAPGGSKGGSEETGGNEEGSLVDGGNSSGSDSKKSKLLNNQGKSAVLQNGIVKAVMDGETARGFSWINKKITHGIVILNGASVSIKNTRSYTKYRLKNGKLKFKTQLSVYYTPAEYTADAMPKNEIKNQLKEQIKREVEQSLIFCKTENLDIFGFYNRFHKFNNKALNKYLKNSANAGDYLQNCEIELSIKAIEKK